MPFSDEIWLPVPSAAHYLATSFGRILVVPYQAPMPHGGLRQYGGHATFGTWNAVDGRFITVHKRRTYRVAPLVCEAFHGPKPSPSSVCMRTDEDAANNVPGNLQWGTQKENLNAPGYLFRLRKRPSSASCAECSAVFAPRYPDQKYCCRQCSYANNSAHSAARYLAPEWR